MDSRPAQVFSTSRRMGLPKFLWARRRPLQMMSDIGQWPGDLAEVKISRQSFVLLKHPDLVQELLVGNAGRIAKRRTPERERFFAFLGDGLLNSEGDPHRRQRRLMLPSFHRSRLAAYGEVMVNTTRSSMASWRAGDLRNATEDMMGLTLDVVGNCLFSAGTRHEAAVIAKGFSHLVTNLNQMIFPGAAWVLRLPLPFARRIRRSQAQLDQFVFDLIRARRAQHGSGEDLLSTLLAAEDADHPGERLSDLEIRNQVMTLFFAGQETTANALSWIWWLLAKHPEIEAELHAELDRVLAQRPPAFDDLPQLDYLGKVVSEVLRLYPPVWTMGREALADFQLGPTAVAKGSLLLASQWVIHRDSRWFKAPETFSPARWTPQFRKDLHRFAYFPFGGGTHSCIAENFAWAELVLVTATVAQKWRLAMTEESSSITPFPRITLGSDRPVKLRLERR